VKIAVVIPALDEADRIRSTILSVRAPEVEILVVDGGSGDATRARAEEAGARVISSPPGRARQLAAGLADAGARAEAVVLLHADTRLTAGWDGLVRAALADPGIVGGAFEFAFDVEEARDAASWDRVSLALVQWVARLRSRVFQLPYGDQALFLRGSVVDAIGGVPQVPLMEDLDLVVALRRRGRLALLAAPAVTSPRRHLGRGVLRTALRNVGALIAWRLGIDRDRAAAWYRR
jgi:rSAM/selenodomain-associated transferase 2